MKKSGQKLRESRNPEVNRALLCPHKSQMVPRNSEMVLTGSQCESDRTKAQDEGLNGSLHRKWGFSKGMPHPCFHLHGV